MNPECPIPGLHRGVHRHQQRDGGRRAALCRDRAHAGASEAARRRVRRAQRALRLLVLAQRISAGAAANFPRKVLCTVKLSRRLFPEHARHNLDAVMERNGLTCGAQASCAGGRARCCVTFGSSCAARWTNRGSLRRCRRCSARISCPHTCRQGLADDLPEGPGVYRFFGADDALLYVGKSHSLRARVCGHFAGGAAEGKDGGWAAQVRRVDWVETAGELGAMLREARMDQDAQHPPTTGAPRARRSRTRYA